MHIVVQFIQSSIWVLSALHWLFHSATKVSFSTSVNVIIHAENFVVQFISSDFISSSQQKLHRDTLIRFIHWYRFYQGRLYMAWGCIALIFIGSWGALFIVGSIVDSCTRSTVATCPTGYCKSAVVQFIALVVILSAKAAASQRHLSAQKFSPERYFAVCIRLMSSEQKKFQCILWGILHSFIAFSFGVKNAIVILGLLYQFRAGLWSFCDLSNALVFHVCM